MPMFIAGLVIAVVVAALVGVFYTRANVGTAARWSPEQSVHLATGDRAQQPARSDEAQAAARKD
jgi:hypothetical protein